MRSFEETAAAFERACTAAGVGYAFIGGMAVNAWGQHRNTSDLDVLVDLDPGRVGKLAEALAREDLRVSAEDLRSAFADRSHVTVDDPSGEIHLDLKLARAPEERAQVREAVELEVEALPGTRIRVARPEDTLAYKLHFGSPRDIEDARSILSRQRRRMDMRRLQGLALKLGVAGELKRLMEELPP